ncbi:MAG TPA: ArsR family transcriptional regulator [Candidatus Nitrosotalea sp.]|nr:ArsR family transcriptional regulator [Candidatus Nitrosotalea sp.]
MLKHIGNNNNKNKNDEKTKMSLLQLKESNIDQKILKILADVQARTILFSIIKKGKTTIDLFEEHRIPISTIYKKITELEDLDLIVIEKYIIANRGKRFKVYRSKISGAAVRIPSLNPVVELFPNSNENIC